MTLAETSAALRRQTPQQELTTALIEDLTPDESEKIIGELIAKQARIREKGKILAWSQFNENPSLLVNRLLAQLLVSKIGSSDLEGLHAHNIAVVSIENSASYLATEVIHELERKLSLDRPPRIVRVRKAMSDKPPSPAMGEHFVYTTVYPITSAGEPRHLVASMSEPDDLAQIRLLLAVDDFRATGNTLIGGVELGLALMEKSGANLSEVTVVPMAGLGKPDQSIEATITHPIARIRPIITAADVQFWADPNSGLALIRVNSFPPLAMLNATAADFAPAN